MECQHSIGPFNNQGTTALHLLNTQADLTSFKRIGLFDSGLGGLSVLRRLAELPDANTRSFVYVGDTARCPYGNRDGAEIALFVEQIVQWLLGKNVDAVIMACNTSAAMARAAADAVSTVPVFDLITPTAQHVAHLNGKIGVMATMSTARSAAFSRAIKQINQSAEVVEYGCPDLVPIVESGVIESDASRAILSSYIRRLRSEKVDNVILGCTHFPFLRAQLEKLADGQITFIDPAQILSGTHSSEQLSQYECDLYVTGDRESFAKGAMTCLGDIPFAVQRVSIGELEEAHRARTFAISTDQLSPSVVSTVVQ